MALSLDQKLLRMGGLGGSDMNSLSGCREGWSPIDIWRSKVDVDFATARHPLSVDAKRGLVFEAGIVQWFCEDEDATVSPCDTLVSADHPLVRATPDGLVHFADGRRPCGLECKFPRLAKDWRDPAEPGAYRIPDYIYPQLMWECHVLGVDRVAVAAMLDHEVRIFYVPFDRALFDALLHLAEQFWHNHVLTRVPPPPDGSEAFRAFLADMYPSHTPGRVLEADAYARSRAEQLAACDAQIKLLTAQKNLLSAELKAQMADAERLDCGDGGYILWRRAKTSRALNVDALIKGENITADTLEKYMEDKEKARAFRPYLKGGVA